MGAPFGALAERARASRTWLRERGLVTLAAAVLLEVSAAAPGGRPSSRAALRALALVLLLVAALVATAIDGLLSLLVDRARAASIGAARRIRAAAAALEARALALRARVIASVARAVAWAAPRVARILALFAERVLTPLVARATLVWARTRADTTPRIARLRRELAASRVRAAGALRDVSVPAARGIARARARAEAIPLPRVQLPLPTLSLRTLRVVTVGVTLSFVFATAIGTTGLIATHGTIALGASTTLTIISGEVSVLAPGASEFTSATDGSVLQAGMTIRTSTSSYAILTYFEGSTVSIDPETTLVIEALQAHPDGSTVIEMRQDVGRTWHAVAKLLSQGSKYTVRTPTATATVRGTLFLVGVEEDEQGVPVTLIETTEGAVAAERAPTPEAPQGEEVIVPAGFQVRAKPAEAIPPPVPAPEPDQKVTVTSSVSNTIVYGPDRRPNGEINGKLVVTTPGAKVEKKPDGSISVTLRNVEGKISTVVQPTRAPSDAAPQPPAPVQVVTVVTEKGKGESRSEETVQPSTTAPAVTGVEVKKAADPAKPAEIRKLDETEKKDAPTVKLPDPPKPGSKPAQDAKKGDGEAGKSEKGEGAPSGTGGGANTVRSFAQLTLPPLSAEELARRDAERRKAEERARQDAARKDDERRAADQKAIEELRQAEERAKAEAARLGDERRKAEERAGEERKRSEERGRDADKPAEEARKAEAKAKEEAEKAGDARRKAEEKDRQESIKREEERIRDSGKKAEELRRAEEKAKEEAVQKLEELRRIEEKARQQAGKLDDERRLEAERRLEEFRKHEERTRQEEAKRLEEQRRAEERAKEDAERRLRELRQEEERARDEARRRADDRRRDEERRREDSERTNFVPTQTLKPLPGAGSRSVEEEAQPGQRGERDDDGGASASKPRGETNPRDQALARAAPAPRHEASATGAKQQDGRARDRSQRKGDR